jgi:hypothetical protein
MAGSEPRKPSNRHERGLGRRNPAAKLPSALSCKLSALPEVRQNNPTGKLRTLPPPTSGLRSDRKRAILASRKDDVPEGPIRVAPAGTVPEILCESVGEGGLLIDCGRPGRQRSFPCASQRLTATRVARACVVAGSGLAQRMERYRPGRRVKWVSYLNPRTRRRIS